jgi:hypothetical protein
MDCPACKNAMITLELADVEIDHCNNCGGIWLDAGELEILLGHSQKAAQLLRSFRIDHKCAEKKRKCPICLKKMQKVIVGQSATQMADKSDTKLLIDKCTKGDGLWFDRWELQNILKVGSFDKENKVAELLTDMFGL